ncbi:MAG: ATP synthase subunit I [Candidatus Porifericomitaceae bacterium WSBS_2022_MAG_OTU9]
MNPAGWRLAVQIARIQAIVAVVLALCLWPLFGTHNAASALLGGLVPVCATICMGISMFVSTKKTPKQILGTFFMAEVWRLAVVGVLLWAIFAFSAAAPGYVLGAFALGLAMQSIACFKMTLNESRN